MTFVLALLLSRHLFINQARLFQETALHSEREEIQESLDTRLPSVDGFHSLPGSNHSVAETLMVFLEVLPEPVIPFAYYSQCIELHNDFSKSVQVRCVYFDYEHI